LFGRSFSDEFGEAIKNDLMLLGVAFFLVIIYLFVNLGKRDVVHSMFAMSFVCVICVGLSFAGCSGLGGFFGVKTNPLNNNIPFLLLGLGVDDAFVLTSELVRHYTANSELDTPTLIAMTAKTGGASVLITSLTDALAFLVGSSTQLPALSAFCFYAGLGVVLCFHLQIFLFLPILALNLRRAKENRLDCLCCKQSRMPHAVKEPQGCCCCLCAPKCNPADGLVQRGMGRAGNMVVKTTPGKITTLAMWAGVLAVGIAGASQIKKDFNLEWFFPAGSYVNDFIELNDKYFSRGTDFKVYTNKLDIFKHQDAMNELVSYMKVQDFIMGSSVSSWWENYRTDPTQQLPSARSEFFEDIWAWCQNSDHRGDILWKDPKCNNNSLEPSACDPTKGIAHSRVSATLNRMENGDDRFEAINKMRIDLKDMFSDDTGTLVFPFGEDFLFWEENGTIAFELTRNLVIAAGIIFAIICLLIPRPRIACIVAIGICLSIVELIGFMHWWGVTINGTSTIYVLICMGLSVDYSAHIAHAFKESCGSMQDRAIDAMTRIGPSVFHALFSTILAVLALSSSKSYVFQVFFKVLFLVTVIAGFKGLWLLPVVLSLVGGSQLEEVNEVSYTEGSVTVQEKRHVSVVGKHIPDVEQLEPAPFLHEAGHPPD